MFKTHQCLSSILGKASNSFRALWNLASTPSLTLSFLTPPSSLLATFFSHTPNFHPHHSLVTCSPLCPEHFPPTPQTADAFPSFRSQAKCVHWKFFSAQRKLSIFLQLSCPRSKNVCWSSRLESWDKALSLQQIIEINPHILLPLHHPAPTGTPPPTSHSVFHQPCNYHEKLYSVFRQVSYRLFKKIDLSKKCNQHADIIKLRDPWGVKLTNAQTLEEVQYKGMRDKLKYLSCVFVGVTYSLEKAISISNFYYCLSSKNTVQ